jgi:hypothetical protein
MSNLIFGEVIDPSFSEELFVKLLAKKIGNIFFIKNDKTRLFYVYQEPNQNQNQLLAKKIMSSNDPFVLLSFEIKDVYGDTYYTNKRFEAWLKIIIVESQLIGWILVSNHYNTKKGFCIELFYLLQNNFKILHEL